MQSIHAVGNTVGLAIERIVRLLQPVKAYVLKHKILTSIAVLVLLGVAWYAYAALTNTSGQTRYVLSTAQTGTVVASVSASGQVSANQSVSLMPKASGQVVSVGVVPGQQVKAGTLIAEIDPTTALQSVVSAKADVTDANIALAKLTEPADALSTAQASNAVTGSYDSARTDLVSTYLDLAAIMSDLKSINQHIGANNYGQWTIDYNNQIAEVRTQAGVNYDGANAAYQKSFSDYSSADITSADAATLQTLVQETIDTVTKAGDAVKEANAFLNAYTDAAKTDQSSLPTTNASDLTTLSTDGGKIDTHATALGSDGTSIEEDTLSLQKLQSGADPLDVQSAELNVTKAENSLAAAETDLSNYYIRAPFDGIIGDVNVQKYDQAGSGAVATIITSQQVADLSLNEVDAAKIAVGDKATLTFDAIPDLTLTGTVAEIDPVGAVSQGVVSYDVKLAFDSQDPRIKTGMTVNADIQTAVAQDVLLVPSGAIKTAGGQSYVLAFVPPLASSTAGQTAASQGVVSATPPQMIPVTTGVSDDTNIEITSGLENGQQIVVRTVSGSTAARTTTTTSAPGGAASRGGFGGGGAGIRL